MQHTFEVTIAGCSNRCAHCSADGGPAGIMPYDDFVVAIDKLRDITYGLPGQSWITFGNEIFCHPQIADILRRTKAIVPHRYPYGEYGVPTTGIALLAREDKYNVIEALKEAGCALINLTLHGGREGHNLIAQNDRTYDSVLAVAALLNAEGIPLEFNLMLNKFLVEDFDSVRDAVKPYPGAYVHITVPSYLPTNRLRGFQRFRADYAGCQRLRGRLSGIGLDEDEFFNRVEAFSERNIAKALVGKDGFDYAKEEAKQPDWMFINVTQELDVFYGNVGLHTERLGNLRTDSAEDVRRRLLAKPANYDWSAYYNVRDLPDIHEVLRRVAPLETDYVYNSINDCVYRWFDMAGVETILPDR